MNIRKAIIDDLSRVAEIYVFNNRINFFPNSKMKFFPLVSCKLFH